MPMRIRSQINSSESQAGPIVQMIFARRKRSATACGAAAETGKPPSTRSSFPSFKPRILSPENAVNSLSLSQARPGAIRPMASQSASFGIYLRRRNFRGTSRKKHGIEFGANQYHQRDQVHPYQQRNAHTERTVNHAVVRIVLQIPSKEGGGEQPHGGGKHSARQNAVPGLRAGHRVVIDKLDHGDAGEDRDAPAHRAPQQQN